MGAVAALVTAAVIIGALNWTPGTGTDGPPAVDAPLVFSDEFDGAALDRGKWSDQRGLQPYHYGSPFNPDIEDAFFVPEQVRLSEGSLHLIAEPHQIFDPVGNAEYSHISGMVHTGAHFAFTYGYVEARIKVPDEAIFWPAFWMLPAPVDAGWPPEIDIVEFHPGKEYVYPTFNVHWSDEQGDHAQAQPLAYGEPGKSYGDSWHTYGLLWEPGKLTVYLDGEPGPVFEGPHVPSVPMYIVLNLGMGEGATPEDSGSMLVDYVRVWSHSPVDVTSLD